MISTIFFLLCYLTHMTYFNGKLSSMPTINLACLTLLSPLNTCLVHIWILFAFIFFKTFVSLLMSNFGLYFSFPQLLLSDLERGFSFLFFLYFRYFLQEFVYDLN